MTKYIEIVFMQGDEGREVVDALYNVEGVVASGVTAESVQAAVEHLVQWESGDEPEPAASPSWGSADATWEEGDLTLSANLGLGYVALTRRVN